MKKLRNHAKRTVALAIAYITVEKLHDPYMHHRRTFNLWVREQSFPTSSLYARGVRNIYDDDLWFLSIHANNLTSGTPPVPPLKKQNGFKDTKRASGSHRFKGEDGPR